MPPLRAVPAAAWPWPRFPSALLTVALLTLSPDRLPLLRVPPQLLARGGNPIAAGSGAPYGGPVITYRWRGPFDNVEVNALHAEGFGHEPLDDDWWAQVNRHSLGWACAREGSGLVGFVNVAWDGAVHAFILDALVSASLR